MRHLAPLSLLLLSPCVLAQSAAPPALSPSAPASTASVEISASRDAARQQDSSAMTVIGREDLLRYGDQSVADALKRVPGITVSGVPGRGGEIRMRGLGNGYTRILLDGQPAPNGFAIDSIAPEQIERVEVLRVASAQTGAQAIAGTINIILRKSAARPERDLKAALALSHDRVSPDLAAQFGERGERWNASLGVVAVDARGRVAVRDDERGAAVVDDVVTPTLQRVTRVRTDTHRPTLNLTPRLAWTLANGDTLTSTNFLRFLAIDVVGATRESTTLGAPTSFPANASLFRAHTATTRHDLQWLHQMEQGGRVELQLGRSTFRRGAVNVFTGLATPAAEADGVTRVVDSRADEQVWNLTGKWTVGSLGTASDSAAAGHALVLGWDGARGRRGESRRENDSALVTQAPAEDTRARLERLAVYIEDDWTVTPALALSLGARYEVFHIVTDGTVLAGVDRRLHAGGPLLQARWKTSKEGQLRLGVTRTFKLPTLTQLSMRRYTVDNNNSPLLPDEQGNGALLPERAWGLDLAYEHYFSKRSMVSASAYARRIDDVTINRVEQRGASWVSMPDNAGRATARGLEVEAKTLWQGYELRANAARNWSRVDSLAAPDNRLPGQTPYSAGLGVDRRFVDLPLTVGASLNLQGRARYLQSARVVIDNGSTRELTMTALWRLDARASWRLTGSNLLAGRHRDSGTFSSGAERLTTLTTTPTWSTIRLVYERKL